MKKTLLILTLSMFSVLTCFGQDDDNESNNEKIRDKMTEFIQRRMGLSKGEAQKFRPVFVRYFREWRTTLRDNRGDKQVLQMRIAELRIRYRNDFRDIVGEKRCNQIYEHQDIFIQEVKKMRREQIDRRPVRRTRGVVIN